MGSILVVTEIQNGKIRGTSYELATIAHEKLGGREVKSLVLGSGVSSEAEAFAKKGGGEVFVADDEKLANYEVDAYSKVVRAAVENADAEIVLIANTTNGWDLAPRVAAALDAAFVSDCVDAADESGPVFTRKVFNGKLDARVRPQGERTVATFQGGAAGAYEGSTDGKVTPLEVSIDAGEMRTKFVEVKAGESQGVDLTKASVVVSGGRGVGAPEKFPEVIQPLADALGGAMGASRPVVDSGWLPHAHQVGSSGQVVQPKLYIACGISGAIQHLVGMKTSNYIVAINKDKDAPIFEVADLGVVGDLFEIVPALTQAVQEAKSG